MKNVCKAVIVTLCAAMVFVACGDPEGSGGKTFTVTFENSSGSPVAAQTIAEGGKASAPTPPVKAFVPAAGLYQGALPDECDFDGWYNGDAKWDFDTDTVTGDIILTAKWEDPVLVPIDVSGEVGDNDVAKGISYAQTNASPDAEFTLVVGNDVTLGQRELHDDDFSLTIIGINGVRTITQGETDDIYYFQIDNPSASLTLGRNITLMGRLDSNYTGSLVNIYAGKFTMEEGSKITKSWTDGSYAGAVCAEGEDSYFFMKGGEITGNKYGGSSNIEAAGVSVHLGATFIMSGGRIIGNTTQDGTPADVSIVGGSSGGCQFTLSGDAQIGALLLFDFLPVITLDGLYTGNVGALNLAADSNSIDHIIDGWEQNNTILEAGSNYQLAASDVGKFPLGNFIAGYGVRQPISDTHIIAATGADIGKLISR